MYLIAYMLAALAIAWLSRRVHNLAWLSLAFAYNALLFSLLPVDEWRLLYAGMADVIMALLAVVLWCHASRKIGRLALACMMVNFIMFGWHQIDFWYDGYLVFYHLHGPLVRAIEVSQLVVLGYHTPAMQGLHADRRKGEPPCKWMEMSLP